VLSGLHQGGGRPPGGPIRGLADPRGQEASGGQDHPPEDLRLLLPHHQGPGGQHGAAGRPAEEGETSIQPDESPLVARRENAALKQ